MTVQRKKKGAKSKSFSQPQEADEAGQEDSHLADAAGEDVGDTEGEVENVEDVDESVGPRKRRKRAGRSGLEQRGPPTVQGSGAMSGGASDEWQTTRRSWEAVSGIFKSWRGRRVWMPFYYDGQCADYVRELGFKQVVHRPNDDFFIRVRDTKFMRKVDFIWDNPPYTSQQTKEEVLRTLAATGKPFAMLLPISVLHVAFVREVLDMTQVQAIIPRRVFVRKSGGDEVPFKYLCWLCYKMRLKRDLHFIEDGDDGGADDS